MTDDTASGSITDEDVGLPVLDSEGNQIGVLADAADGDVTIDPDPDVSDDARASLGWNPSDDAARTLDASELERVDGEDVPDAFPKTALGRDREAGEGGDVLRVDLGTVDRSG